MNKCTRCGTVTDGAFCPKCGGPTVAEAAPAPQVIVNTPAAPRTITKEDLPEQYRPLSAWAYWGLTILYAVPIVGFIFLIIHTFNGSNINRRSFARSYWIWTLICVIVSVIAIVIVAATVGFSGLWDQIANALKQ